MAKVILEEKLRKMGRENEFDIESAGVSPITGVSTASFESVLAMIVIYGKTDLLADHVAKQINPELIDKADLILVMTPYMKNGLPPEKTYALKEYAGEEGSISDPFGTDSRAYIKTAREISRLLDKIIPKLIG